MPLLSFLRIRLTREPHRKGSRVSSERRRLHHYCTLSIIAYWRRPENFIVRSVVGMGEQYLCKPTLPSHTGKATIVWMHWNDAIRTLSVYFSQQRLDLRYKTLFTSSSKRKCEREQSYGSLPSLTLLPPDEEMSSKISRHFPGWCGLGITPKELIWRFSAPERGSATRRRALTFRKYGKMVTFCSFADSMLILLCCCYSCVNC